MQVKLWVLLLVATCALLGAFGQLFFKLSSGQLTANPISWVNFKLILGLSLYGFATIGFLFALKHGELSLLYPIIATSYVWVAVLSVLMLGETMFFMNWIGILLIILGVTLTTLKTPF